MERSTCVRFDNKLDLERSKLDNSFADLEITHEESKEETKVFEDKIFR